MSFKKDLYEVIRGLIHPEVAKHCRTVFNMMKNVEHHTKNISENDNKYAFNDGLVEKCFSWYSPFIYDAILLDALPKIETVIGKELYPSYSYGRIYYHDAQMRIHRDRPSCEYSATICIQNDPNFGPWEIWFRTLNHKDVPIFLNEGDAIVYKGTELYHWRDNYKGQEQYQAFIHYVDKNGLYKDYKYDKRPCLGIEIERPPLVVD